MRRSQAAVLVTVLAVLLSGCSTNQVKAWFAVFAGQDLTPTEAERIASQVNAEMVPGCDENYSGVCVPNNTTDVDCWGLGDGPNWVVGPILVPGWDHYDLDPDGDKVACPVSPPPPPPTTTPTTTTTTTTTAPPAPPVTTFGDVDLAVGMNSGEVDPGTYGTTAEPGRVCTWLRSAPNGAPLVGKQFTGLEFVELPWPGRVRTTGGCSWTKAGAARPVPSSGDATYRIGFEIQPGWYRTSGGANCVWHTMANLAGNVSATDLGNASDGPQLVILDDTMNGFESRGCGTWNLLVDPAPERIFAVFGDAGEFVTGGQRATWTEADGPVTLTGTRSSVAAGAGGYVLQLSAPSGGELAAGTYANAHRTPVPGGPGIDFGGHGRSCNEISGSFKIDLIEFDANGAVTSLLATSELFCENLGKRVAVIVAI